MANQHSFLAFPCLFLFVALVRSMGHAPAAPSLGSTTSTSTTTVLTTASVFVTSTRTATSSPTSSGFVTLASPTPASTASAASSWWYANIDHTSPAVRDYVPNLYTGSSPNTTYPVYFSIQSGDAAGFVNAITAAGPNGLRNNMWLAGQPRVIYLAPGTYNIGSTVNIYTDTVIIGDASNPPTLKAQANFNGDYLLCGGAPGNDTTGNGGELHFSVMLKNVILDTTSNAAQGNFAALSWRTAQNSALVNIQINMPVGVHTGIWMGQGSTLAVGDVAFNNGAIGFHYAGMEQATLKNMKFANCAVGIQIENGFSVNVFAPSFQSVANPILFNPSYYNPWVSVVDATATSCGTFFNSTVTYPNFMLENISQDSAASPMVVVDGTTKVGGVQSIGTYVYGNTYGANPVYQTGQKPQPLARPAALAPGGKYPVLTPPQYLDVPASGVINLKDSTQNGGNILYGNGVNDDCAALQAGLNLAASQGKVAYLPFGVYRVQSTITIPSGTRLVGNAWSTISGYGSLFADESNPQPIVRVGTPGSSGTAVLQDLRFTVGQQLPGAIVLQVNMAGANPGDVAIFNSLITVGGTRDTELSCLSEANCRGAYTGLHLSATSSAYIENFWSWLADHEVDDSSSQNRVAAKQGVLVEATKGTWLMGLASEHWWLTNLNWNNAQNVMNTLFQSETNYFQGSSAPITTPAPFTPTSSDPTFNWCSGSSNPNCWMTIAQYFNGGSGIYQYGAASWNFYAGTQETMNVAQTAPTNLRLYGLGNHDTAWLMRMSNGSKFGNGSADGFGGAWGSIAAAVSM